MNTNYYLHASSERIYIHHRTTSSNPSKDFILHQHAYPEIYFFISGKCDFVFEGTTYTLSPYDMMIIPPYTLHQPIPEIDTTYTRYVLHLFDEFFSKSEDSDIYKIFSKYNYSNSKIPGNTVRKTDLINIFNKISKYSDNFKNIDQPIVNYLIYEILYIINSITIPNTFNEQNMVVQDIIGYINANHSSIESIKDISDKLHYSQSYISHLFKMHTGLTIREYIISKRLIEVENLVQQGKSLTSACIESGFSSYNNFAYAYKKIYNKSPKQILYQAKKI